MVAFKINATSSEKKIPSPHIFVELGYVFMLPLIQCPLCEWFWKSSQGSIKAHFNFVIFHLSRKIGFIDKIFKKK